MAEFSPCEVTLAFADGEYPFRLKLKGIAELQEKCGAGLGAIYQRMMIGHYRVEDCTETIRLGLIGGGMDAQQAKKLTDRYGEDMPKADLWNTARLIMLACVQGYDPPEPGKEAAATAGSTSPPPSGSEPNLESGQPPSEI